MKTAYKNTKIENKAAGYGNPTASVNSVSYSADHFHSGKSKSFYSIRKSHNHRNRQRHSSQYRSN